MSLQAKQKKANVTKSLLHFLKIEGSELFIREKFFHFVFVYDLLLK